MASTYLQRTISSAGNQKKWTWSAWFKKASIGVDGGLFSFTEDSNNYFRIRFRSSDKLQVDNNYGGSSTMSLILSRVQRDTNGFYHVVVAYDSAQGTASNRVKIYVNGTQETALDTSTYPSQNANTRLGNTGSNIELGRSISNQYFNGIFSHVHYCDGYAYAASDFGSTDSATGEWKINTSPSVSYGTNGFFWLKDSIATTDHSPNSNTFTVGGGTLTKTEDNPSNNFATLNPLSVKDAQYGLTYGNNRLNTGSSQDWANAVAATLGATGGKFYWEVKWNAGDGYSITGVIPASKYDICSRTSGTAVYDSANALQLNASGNGTIYNAVASNGTLPQQTVGHIFMFALDMENKKMWFGSNGTWYNSGNPGAGSNETWASSQFTEDDVWVPYAQGHQVSSDTTFNFNFGNGYFEGTAVSSAGTNASNNGIFEYDVPSGFTALSTKGLNL